MESRPQEFSGRQRVQGRSAAENELNKNRLVVEYATSPAEWGQFVYPLYDGHGATYTRSVVLDASGVPGTIGGGAIDADALAATLIGENSRSFGYGFNGVTWDRLRVAGDNVDAVAAVALGKLQVNSITYGFNGATFDRLRSAANNADALAVAALGSLQTNSMGFGFNGATFDRLRVASFANVDTTARGVQKVTGPEQITDEDRPAANVAASAALAAPGVGSRNIVTGLTISLAAGATASGIVSATLSDGVTTFWSAKMACVIGDSKQLDISDCEFPGADNAAMTLAVTAGGATTEVTAALRGYIVA